MQNSLIKNSQWHGQNFYFTTNLEYTTQLRMYSLGAKVRSLVCVQIQNRLCCLKFSYEYYDYIVQVKIP